jgi:hypothetical protein
MYKFFKMIVVSLLVVLSLQQVAFASGEVPTISKPTEGIESSDPNHGSSIEVNDVNNSSIQSVSSLFYNYYCSIDNTGIDLYLEGTSVSNYLSDQVSVILYLQKWDGSQWVDVQSWSFDKYSAKSITDGVRTSYQSGNYYRTRAVHYIKYGSQTEIQNSTSAYISIN